MLNVGAHWRHLANTIESSMCDGDANFSSNFFYRYYRLQGWASESLYDLRSEMRAVETWQTSVVSRRNSCSFGLCRTLIFWSFTQLALIPIPEEALPSPT